MPNELLLLLSLLFFFGGALAFYWVLDIEGLYCWTAIATIAANIEVLVLVDAFGMEQTLGNVLFASTFLVTDIISEVAGKEKANKAVNIGIMTSIAFIVISQMWLSFTPNQNDWAYGHMEAIFSNTPRLMVAGFVVYAIVQRFDVWAYHKWWAYTKRISGDSEKYLWLRNNGSTMVSQILNTILYTFFAFWGMFRFSSLLQICLSSCIIFFITSLADTPFVYLARKIAKKKVEAKQQSQIYKQGSASKVLNSEG